MRSSKQLVFVALAVLLAAVAVSSTPYYSGYNGYAAAPNKSHNLIMGARQPGDRLMYAQNIIKASKILQVVTAQQLFDVGKYNVITQVRALDQKTNGNGAIASRLSGGPGYSNITLKFKSQRGHGINFIVEVYGRTRY